MLRKAMIVGVSTVLDKLQRRVLSSAGRPRVRRHPGAKNTRGTPLSTMNDGALLLLQARYMMPMALQAYTQRIAYGSLGRV